MKEIREQILKCLETNSRIDLEDLETLQTD